MAGKNKRRKPKKVTCTALRKDGLPCRAEPFTGFERCQAHEPQLKEYHSYRSKFGAWKRDKKRGIVRPMPVYRGCTRSCSPSARRRGPPPWRRCAPSCRRAPKII